MRSQPQIRLHTGYSSAGCGGLRTRLGLQTDPPAVSARAPAVPSWLLIVAEKRGGRHADQKGRFNKCQRKLGIDKISDMTEQSNSDAQRPASLFHYTNASGLLGILNDSLIWASDLRFLNDAQEMTYALDLFKHSLDEMVNPALDPSHPVHEHAESFGAVFESYKSMVRAEMGGASFSIYVACFCEFGDLLSQWRAYGSDHGYAIEFKTAALNAAIGETAGYPPARMLAPVHYGVKAAASALVTAVKDVTKDTNLGHVGVHAHYMALRLSALLATVKHPGFREEREWRTIAGFEKYDHGLTKFRSSSMAIMPYIEIPFPRDAIISIRVGPGRHTDIRKQGVQQLVDKADYKAEVLSSEVPLRS